MPKKVFRNRVEYRDSKGKLHKVDGPAVEYKNGLQSEWWLRGQRHRNNGPALISANGDKEWYMYDQLHREKGPAVITIDGLEIWYRYGVIHREDGPAIVYPKHYVKYVMNGKTIDIYHHYKGE